MKRPHNSAASLALTWALSLAASMPCLPQSLLGQTDTAIIDENNKVVGKGPQFDVKSAAPVVDDPTAPGADEYLAALKWMEAFLEQLNGLERDSVAIRMELRTLCLSIRDWSDFTRKLRKTRRVFSDDATADFIAHSDKLIADAAATIKERKEAQDKLIADTMRRWDDLLSSLDKKIEASDNLPKFRSSLEALRTVVQKKRQLGEMELYLTAGQSRHFRKLAREASTDPELAAPVHMMRFLDYMDQGNMRLALYAARKGQQEFPDNQLYPHLVNQLEASYLSLFAAKAREEGAQIHRAWTDYVGNRGTGYLRDALFGGLSKTFQSYVGTVDAMEELAGNAHDRAIMEYNGMEVMRRLHAKGLSFDEIRGLSSEQLRDKMNELFELQNPLDLDTAKGLSLAVRAAFRNDDVKRLRKQSREQFDADLGRSSLTLTAFDFDQEWYSVATDAVNAKNALLFFGPSAVVRYSKAAPGLMSRLTRGWVPTKQFQGAVTARDWVMSRPSIEQAAKWLGGGRAGQVLSTLTHMRYEAAAPVRFATGVTQGLAELALLEGASQAGKALGGEWGQFMAEAVTSFGLNPFEIMEHRYGRTMEKTAVEMAERRAKWEAQNALLENKARAPIHEAAEVVADGRKLTRAQAAALEEAAESAGEVAARARKMAGDDGSALLQGTADEAEALVDTANAVKKAEGATARVGSNVAKKLESSTKKVGETTRRNSDALLAAADDVPPPRPSAKRPEASTGSVRLENDTWTKPKRAPPGETPPLPPAAERQLLPPTAREAEKLGDQAMSLKNFDEAESLYRMGLMDDSLEASQRASLAAKAKDAKAGARYAGLRERAKSSPGMRANAAEAERALKEFEADELDYLKNVPKDRVEDLAGAGGAKKILDADGNPLAIWKPKGRQDALNGMVQEGQMVAELIASKLAKRLGLRMPHVERGVLGIVGEAAQEGVLMRHIPGTRSLGSLPPGVRAALKDQVAKFRPLHVLTGNYDVHMENYLVDSAGRVWAIDFGMSMLKTPTVPLRNLNPARQIPGFVETGDEVTDWARFFRDWYRNHSDAGTAESVRHLDDLIHYGDMQEVVRDVRKLGYRDYEEIVRDALTPRSTAGATDDILTTHPDARGIVEGLNDRTTRFKNLIDDRWRMNDPRVLKSPSRGGGTTKPAPNSRTTPDGTLIPGARLLPEESALAAAA